jgi:hypothetical protein
MENSTNAHPDPSKLTQTDHINKKLLLAFRDSMDKMNIPPNNTISTDDGEESDSKNQETVER